MIRILSEKFLVKGETGTFKEITENLKKNSKSFLDMPLESIILLFDEFSRKCVRDPKLRGIEGINFLSIWMKRISIENMISINFTKREILEKFIEIKDNHFIKAQPRGLACHWIAGNIPTLGLFSWMQSVLCKNRNIVKVPADSIEVMEKLIKSFSEVKTEINGCEYKGDDILSVSAFLSFPRDDFTLNQEMSLAADAKIIWGGADAVNAIKKYPEKESCESLIFGPKYSFAIMDSSFIEENDIEKALNGLVMDIMVFDQAACSSPQILVIEKNKKYSKEDIARMVAKIFNEFSEKYPKGRMNPSTVAKIVNERGMFLLDENKGALFSKAPDWTILIDNEIELNEAVQSRTLFIKETDDLLKLSNQISQKIQTVGIAVKNNEKLFRICDEFTKGGVSRCVRFGSMNHYESPWDGMLQMSRLVRFVTLKK
ncbi:MAG: acyl-CoA reductase [Candidatus Aenigmarchaeota archaeon]|nr:acyl-CoA reductase [Candidatus Aenigmarchaeota archaeon]